MIPRQRPLASINGLIIRRSRNDEQLLVPVLWKYTTSMDAVGRSMGWDCGAKTGRNGRSPVREKSLSILEQAEYRQKHS
jgi:hypothetical protein